jgi:predicted dehydrogenase
MKEFRVGIIGAGDISNRHMKVYSHIPGMKVVAVAEIVQKKLDAWLEKYKGYGKIDGYMDFREMLKRDDIDCVDVCAHNNLHAPLSIAVMKAGKNCYCEKPMSATYADSRLMYDCWKKTGVKFAVQMNSLFTGQTKICKQLIDEDALGEIYHAKAVEVDYRNRPSVDGPIPFTRDFMSKEIAGHGPVIDKGIYCWGQMLYLLGLPDLQSVTGCLYTKIGNPKPDIHIGVEDMATGFAVFGNGVSLELFEASASNMDDIGKSYITGTKGALQLSGTEEVGGIWSMGMPPFGELLPEMQTNARFVGEYHGIHVDTDLKTYYNQSVQRLANPEAMVWYDNQYHWYKYLCGELTDETRYNTPLIALNASLLAEGVVLSNEKHRSVSADEIKAESKSTAIWKQQTPYGVFDYESTF